MNGLGQFTIGNTEREAGRNLTQFYGMILPCKVGMINHRAGKVRAIVHEGGHDPFLTEWIPWLTLRAGNNRSWNPPERGEKGLILSPSGKPKNGYFLPASYYEDAPMPSDDPDVVKDIYLAEEVGVYEYNRRSGRRRWRLHGAGEYRHEIGIFEKDGDKGTSDIIQSRSMIQMRVGNTRLVIKDGLIRGYMVNDQNEEVELKIDFEGIDGRVKDTGVLKVRHNEATLGILASPPSSGSQAQSSKISGMVASDKGAQLIYNELNAVVVDESGASVDSLTSQNRLAVASNGTALMSGASHVLVTPQQVDVRTNGSALVVTPANIVAVTPQWLQQVPGNAQGATYQAGSFFKFSPAKKLEIPQTPLPAELTKEFKPFMPKD